MVSPLITIRNKLFRKEVLDKIKNIRPILSNRQLHSTIILVEDCKDFFIDDSGILHIPESFEKVKEIFKILKYFFDSIALSSDFRASTGELYDTLLSYLNGGCCSDKSYR